MKTQARASLQELEFLFRQLAIAASAGLPLREALDALKDEGGLTALLAARLGEGATLSQALSSAGPLFPRQGIDFVRTAEENDRLPAALETLAADYSRRAAGRRRSLNALYWPAALGVVLMVLLFVVMIFVMPAFENFYADLGAELPAPTRALASISGYAFWIALPLLAASAFFGLFRPMLRAFEEKLFRLRLAGLLALATGEATGFAEAALAHLGRSAPTGRAAGWIDRLTKRLATGTDFFQAMRETAQVPRRVAAMLELGAKSGHIAAARAHVEAWCDTELDTALPRLEADMLIAAYVVIGLVLSFVVVALYLPIFRLGAAM